jgi:uncharacterized protein (TIGR03437 family)
MECFAQTLTNGSLSGKYFVRHVQFTTDANNNVTDARSIIGSMTFTPAGGVYSFTGQQAIGAGSAAAFSVSGTYSVSPGGIVSLTNPQKTSASVNARFGTEAVVGSSTEIGGNTFDIFAAVPAPTAPQTNATAAGAWNATDFELTAASASQVRCSFVQFSLDGMGNLPSAALKGHAANFNSGITVNQSIVSGAYAVNSDGTGTIGFPAPAGVTGAALMMGSTQRTLMLSQTGHVLLAGTPGAHDILIAVLAPTAAVTLTRDWFAGIRVDSTGSSDSYVAGATAIAADSAIVQSRRLNESFSPAPINVSASANYTLAADGTGSAGPSKIAAAAGGIVAANVGSVDDPTGYEIGFGVTIPTVTGAGVFVNPQGVVNAASNAPVGNPISPGEFIAIYGSGLSSQTTTATPPYPSSLTNVSVSIGGLPAPVYLVSPSQINCLVPYGVDTTKSTATVVVTNNNVTSNSVSVPLSATSPGIFSNDLSGTGDGAVTHLDGSLVSPTHPATKGETLTIYLTGLGALMSAVKDGAAPNPPAADPVTAQVVVYVNGIAIPNLLYSGLNPVYPGLYQINFAVPGTLTVSGELPLAVQTADSFTDQINLSVQ